VGDFSAEGAVVHQQDVEVLRVVHYELFEAVGKIVLRGVVRAVADLGHFLVASEATTHAVINAWMGLQVPLGLLQLSASLPPYRSDWKRVNFRVLFFTMRFLSRGVDFTIILFYRLL
jgi:hypothetical protein